MLVGAPDADILREAIEELRKRTKSGAATFLVKVKAHRGESANEEADIQVDKATSDKSSSFRMARASPKRGYEDRKSTWNSGARKVIRRGSVEEEVRKHRDRVTGAWKQISEDASCDPSMITALQHGTWMDEEGLKKTFIKENRQMKKPTSKQTRPFQAKRFPRNGTTGQIEQFEHGKSLAGKEVR